MSLRHAQRMVREFQQTFGQPLADTPVTLDWRRVEFRIGLHSEEAAETNLAMRLGDIDLPAAADGLVDQLYVILGTANEMGIDLEPLFNAVHEANMRKTGGGLAKVQKPPGWTPPDIAGLLRAQGWKGEAK